MNENPEEQKYLTAQIIKIDFIRKQIMMWTIIIVLLVLWGLGVTSSYSFGGLIHLLLVLAAVVFVVKYVTGRKLDL
jgi:hypothetical protein